MYLQSRAQHNAYMSLTPPPAPPAPPFQRVNLFTTCATTTTTRPPQRTSSGERPPQTEPFLRGSSSFHASLRQTRFRCLGRTRLLERGGRHSFASGGLETVSDRFEPGATVVLSTLELRSCLLAHTSRHHQHCICKTKTVAAASDGKHAESSALS